MNGLRFRLRSLWVAILAVVPILFISCSNGKNKEGENDTGEMDQWILVFHDDFNGDAVDTKTWNIEDWASRRNNELQYYHPDEVYVDNGYLILRSRPGEHGGRQYTSGAVNSKDKFEFTFGKVEVRAKLPKGQGIWPAIWMLPHDRSWPPEIDIMEMLGHEPNKTYMTYHWGTYPDHFLDNGHYKGPDFSADFHTYGIEWEPDEIRWYVDGVLRKTYVESAHIVRVPNYILLNTAVGGDWPGSPDSSTVFPQYFEIDYVKVWQKGRGLKH